MAVHTFRMRNQAIARWQQQQRVGCASNSSLRSRRWRPLLACWLGLLPATAASAWSDPCKAETKVVFKETDQLIKQREPLQAYHKRLQAWSQDQECLPMRFKIAVAAHELGRFEEARTLYDMLTEDVYQWSPQSTDGIEARQQILNSLPDRIRNLAMAISERDRRDGAFTPAEKVSNHVWTLKLDPDYPWHQLRLAEAHCLAGNIALGLDLYKRMPELDPQPGLRPKTYWSELRQAILRGYDHCRASLAVTQPKPYERNCDNHLDDDGDALVDCRDPDCEAASVCRELDKNLRETDFEAEAQLERLREIEHKADAARQAVLRRDQQVEVACAEGQRRQLQTSIQKTQRLYEGLTHCKLARNLSCAMDHKRQLREAVDEAEQQTVDIGQCSPSEAGELRWDAVALVSVAAGKQGVGTRLVAETAEAGALFGVEALGLSSVWSDAAGARSVEAGLQLVALWGYALRWQTWALWGGLRMGALRAVASERACSTKVPESEGQQVCTSDPRAASWGGLLGADVGLRVHPWGRGAGLLGQASFSTAEPWSFTLGLSGDLAAGGSGVGTAALLVSVGALGWLASSVGAP